MTRVTTRRRFLAAATVSTAAAIAGCIGEPSGSNPEPNESTATVDELPDAVGLETVMDGLDAPLAVAFAPDADRRYVAEREGYVRVHESNGPLDEPFLDLRDAVETGGERGLLGMALHPEFAENRRVFVRYSAPRRSEAPADYSHTFVVAEFEASDDGRRAERDSERTVLEIHEPRDLHNGGDIAFGPDGYLYLSVGDSGAFNHTGWYDDGGGGGNGQDVTDNLMGSILRIDVDERTEEPGYTVPEDNPLVGRDGLDEHYAWGFRNPWRVSFDGDDFFVADVGQSSYEEVNLVEKGGNYGWNVKEGTHCFKVDDCPDETPESVRDGEPLVDPIVEYPHSGEGVAGVSIVGGYVYRGSALPALEGAYVFGDFQPEGRLFAATRPDDSGPWPTVAIEIADGEESLGRLLSFGRDDGDVYVLGTGDDGGGLFRIVPAA